MISSYEQLRAAELSEYSVEDLEEFQRWTESLFGNSSSTPGQPAVETEEEMDSYLMARIFDDIPEDPMMEARLEMVRQVALEQFHGW